MRHNALYTLGYAGLRVDLVSQWLAANDVVLVDVRFVASSRNPQWRQRYLERTLGSYRYKWVRELGNSAYRSGGPTRLFYPARGVEIVSAILRVQPVVLACVCGGRVESCHRWTAANLISEATGAEIVHLGPADFSPVEQLDLLTPYHRVTS